MTTTARLAIFWAYAAMLPAMGQAQLPSSPLQSKWEFTTKNATITITKYVGSGGAVTIPGLLNGQPVVSIGEKAFWSCTNVTSVTVPTGVTSLGDYAFGMCSNLKGVYFMSNAPSLGSSVFFKDDNLTVYCLPGTAGWSQQCGDRPTARWNLADPGDAAGGKSSE